MSLDRLCKATGLTLAIVGLSVAHSFATEEPTASENLIDSQPEIKISSQVRNHSSSQRSINHFMAEGKKVNIRPYC